MIRGDAAWEASPAPAPNRFLQARALHWWARAFHDHLRARFGPPFDRARCAPIRTCQERVAGHRWIEYLAHAPRRILTAFKQLKPLSAGAYFGTFISRSLLPGTKFDTARLSSPRRIPRAESEAGEKKTFWTKFFEVFGIARKTVASFAAPVKKLTGHDGTIDLYWPGDLIVEHKSLGWNLVTA